MDWQELIKTLGYFGFSVTAISLVLTYLVRKLTEQQLQKDIESFRSDLVRENEKNRIQYTILQERRALVIRKMYQLLERFDFSARDLINPIQLGSTEPEEKRRERTSLNARDFFTYYSEHKIYLDKETCNIIDTINDKYHRISIDFQFKDKIIPEKPENDLWLKSWKSLTEEIPPMRENLEDIFRKIIGI